MGTSPPPPQPSFPPHSPAEILPQPHPCNGYSLTAMAGRGGGPSAAPPGVEKLDPVQGLGLSDWPAKLQGEESWALGTKAPTMWGGILCRPQVGGCAWGRGPCSLLPLTPVAERPDLVQGLGLRQSPSWPAEGRKMSCGRKAPTMGPPHAVQTPAVGAMAREGGLCSPSLLLWGWGWGDHPARLWRGKPGLWGKSIYHGGLPKLCKPQLGGGKAGCLPPTSPLCPLLGWGAGALLPYLCDIPWVGLGGLS